jgi:hypothetical protein
MYCKACGKQIPDDSSFCSKCGASQGASTTVAAEPTWETCEIYFYKTRETSWWGGEDYRFWAEAIGPKGTYNAGHSDEIKKMYAGPGSTDKKDRAKYDQALAGLVRKLTADGWEPLTRGEYWYSHRFRRRVK